jgi:hypothetical protein
LLYNERKRAREEGSGKKEEIDAAEGDEEKDVDSQEDILDGSLQPTAISAMDIMGILIPSRRNEIFSAFAASFKIVDADRLFSDLERDVSRLYSHDHRMKTECEEILCVMAVVILHILTHRIGTISEAEIHSAVGRPWLRHLSFEACLAYILWDIIPILERREFYDFALQSLELLVYGKARSSSDLSNAINDAIDTGEFPDLRRRFNSEHDKLTEAFAHFLLSRRARGKALERIVIDLKHLIGKAEKARQAQRNNKKAASRMPQIEKKFAAEVINHVVGGATVSFSSIRAMAKRLKQPLSITMRENLGPEAKLLGLRSSNQTGLLVRNVSLKKYSDWVPITDTATANAMATEGNLVGGRCSFVGHEDDEEKSGFKGSLNVEQLAMEFYASGRLPSTNQGSDDLRGGGWTGWHDEGGVVRALFRVLCFEILGMDWAQHCKLRDVEENEATIHLSPYQGAPFDLHVGFELADPLPRNDRETQPNRGFYLRHQKKIEVFLEKLGNLDRQEVSDLVWNAIAARRGYMMQSLRKDPSIERDILQCRTLSLVAAGLGGTTLKEIIRPFLFDYRHFSGGLPDLLLVRAKYDDDTLVDLGEWVGEAFDKEYIASLEQERRISLLGDRDDDFLGCSKVGDSGPGNVRNRFGRGRQTRTTEDSAGKRTLKITELPPKLELVHGDSPVKVECLFVEVKSSSDTLDGEFIPPLQHATIG